MKRDYSDGEPDVEEEELGNNVQKKQRIMPKRAEYRMRAHINPLNATPFPYPINPNYVNWKAHYPALLGGTQEQNTSLITCNTVEHPSNYDTIQLPPKQNVEIIDVGCGFGGLLFTLSRQFPEKMIFGLEIRDKLVNYVGEKIRAMRIENPSFYNNISVVRTNSMRHLTQYFRKASLLKIFICFADPHFKAKNFRRRIINTGFLSEYAYLLQPGGKLYCITDVKELHDWHMEHCLGHRQFKQVVGEQLETDPCIELMKCSSEESKKVIREGRPMWYAVFQKIK